MKHISQSLLVACSVAGLSACGGGGGDGDNPQRKGSASIAVTDAAMGGADRVVVEFRAVEFKPKSEPPFTIDLVDEFGEPTARQLDLLELQGANSEILVRAEDIPAGRYQWVRLHINDNPCDSIEPGENPSGSFIDLTDGGIEPLHIPSGNQSGLKINKDFVIAAGGQTDLTVDFDLRKSVVAPQGQDCHFLKPVLRVTDNLETNHITGSIDPALLSGDNCITENADTPAAVYLYEGLGVVPDDLDNEASEPLTTALVNLVDSSYEYEIGFVPAGDYTVALTCDADIDDPEVDNDADSGETDIVSFGAAQNVTVVTGDNPIQSDF